MTEKSPTLNGSKLSKRNRTQSPHGCAIIIIAMIAEVTRTAVHDSKLKISLVGTAQVPSKWIVALPACLEMLSIGEKFLHFVGAIFGQCM